MMFIIFIIITYTRDKNCQLTSRRWKVLLNNLAFLWWGGGGGEVRLSFWKPLPISGRNTWIFPPNFTIFGLKCCYQESTRANSDLQFQTLLKESTESHSISSANGCSLYPFSHQNVFFQKKKKLQKQKKNLWRPKKGSPPPPHFGAPKAFKIQ